jgi:hypothetical protein
MIASPNRTGLPDTLKSGVESLSGLALDDVQVHYNSSQPARLDALAYAQGTDIHVAPGQERHLPHEAWHVVQQAQGRVRPTMQMKNGIQTNDNQGLEHEADVMGKRALQTGPTSKPPLSTVQPTRPVLQAAPKVDKKKQTNDGKEKEKEKERKFKWEKVKSQDGTFLGDPSTFHIHDAGGDMHYKFGNIGKTRVDFCKMGKMDQEKIAEAIIMCEDAPNVKLRDKPAQETVSAYLWSQMNTRYIPIETGKHPLPPVTNFDEI